MKCCSRVFHFIATRFPRKPVVYLFLFTVWFITLWCLSAGNPVPDDVPKIPHLDKLAHFTYFGIGGVFMAVVGLVLWPKLKQQRWRIFCWVVFFGAVIGRLDEYHQTFTPGRSGNDMGDWTADILGCSAGACLVLFIILPEVLRQKSKRKKKES